MFYLKQLHDSVFFLHVMAEFDLALLLSISPDNLYDLSLLNSKMAEKYEENLPGVICLASPTELPSRSEAPLSI